MKRNSIVLLMASVAMLFSLRTHAAGLLAPTDLTLPPLRVTEHSVDVTVQDQIALTTLTQTFHNDTSRRLEATYVFPLPENADLTDFQMSFNGKMVQGQVLPADQARQIYESIVRQSRDPGLIEFIGRRLLQMRVFPIEPNSDTRIQIKYQQICRPISGMNGYHYPLRTAKAGGQVYGTVRFNVNLRTSAPLKNVWSPTHSVEIVREGEDAAKIAYEASKGSLDDDFLLLYDTDSSDLGLSVIAYKPSNGKPGHFVLTLTPKQLWPKEEYQPQDVVFVIDTSGSMAGEKIEQARASLKFCVDQLDERDTFNVVRFSTGVDLLFEQMQPADKEHRAKARELIGQFMAAGGTSITDALKAALDLRPPPQMDIIVLPQDGVAPTAIKQGRPFVMIFITDGIGNQPAEHTMAMVKSHASSTNARVFTFGVGHDVNTLFLDQLATSSNAKPTYVQPGENLELALGDFFAVISQPVLTALRLTLPEIGVTEKFPATLGDLYHGQQLIVAGKFDAPVTGPVKLTATRSGKAVEYVWPSVSFAHTNDATYVPTIWAGRKIAFLVDQIRAHGENKEMVEEVMALSQEHGIQTPYSSWLVNPEQGPIMIRSGPVEFPWQRSRGIDGVAGGGGGTEGGRRALRAAGARVLETPSGPASSPDSNMYHLRESLGKVSGESATELAKQNAVMRDQRSKDESGRLSDDALAQRHIAGQWYNRIGQYLVDDRLTEQMPILTVKFGSEAYFALVRGKPALQAAFAASRNLIVLTADSQAVMISEEQGIEEFSDDQLKQLGLPGRN